MNLWKINKMSLGHSWVYPYLYLLVYLLKYTLTWIDLILCISYQGIKPYLTSFCQYRNILDIIFILNHVIIISSISHKWNYIVHFDWIFIFRINYSYSPNIVCITVILLKENSISIYHYIENTVNYIKKACTYIPHDKVSEYTIQNSYCKNFKIININKYSWRMTYELAIQIIFSQTHRVIFVEISLLTTYQKI